MSTLGSVKVGDYIAWTAPNGCVFIAKAKRLTPTRVITDGQAWRISDGRLIGSLGWTYDWARPATDDDMRAVRIRSARARIEKAAHAISDDDALKVAAFIKSLGVQEAPPAEGE